MVSWGLGLLVVVAVGTAAGAVGCGADRPPQPGDRNAVATADGGAASGSAPSGNVRGIIAQVGGQNVNDTGFLNDDNPAIGMILYQSTVLGPVTAGPSSAFGNREITGDALVMRFGEDVNGTHVSPDPYGRDNQIDVAFMRISANAECHGGVPTLQTSSEVTGVVVNSAALAIAPNERVEQPLAGSAGRVVFNEIIVTDDGRPSRRRFTINAMHVVPADGSVPEIIVGHGEGFISCD
jgi:hypothetical protein